MNWYVYKCGLGKSVLRHVVSLVASCLIVSVSLGQGASPSQTGAHETWLRLYHYSAAEFDLRAIEEDAFQTGPSLTLEDWLLLGRAIPSLESSLRNFLESNRTEIMNRDAFHLDRKCILFDRAIFALGWLETPRDTGKFLAGLANEKMVGLRFFDSALIQAFGMVGDLESVTCLEAIIRNEKTRFSERENAVYALTGGFLRLRHSKGPIDEGVLRTKEKTLVDGLSRFLKDEAFSRSFDVEAIVARYANSGFNATPAQLTKEKLRQ